MKSSSSTISTFSTSSSVRQSGRRESFGFGRNEVVPLGRRDEFSSSLSTLGLDNDPDRGQGLSAAESEEELAERARIERDLKAGKERHARFMANMVESIPEDFKKSGKMVACMICSLIKVNFYQFLFEFIPLLWLCN